MVRQIARFYLLAMALTFSITLWVGATGAPYLHVVSVALLSWPLAALILLGESKVNSLWETAQRKRR
ncbi:hypothetical protein [Oceanibium sediminis]|uniref:hypothetical protein n=1 Tax=Oceanibium sediminis TaxID=2026339 RepID=UPI0013001FF5|nr:hypothetical protein [Oceanibium sediminis]